MILLNLWRQCLWTKNDIDNSTNISLAARVLLAGHRTVNKKSYSTENDKIKFR